VTNKIHLVLPEESVGAIIAGLIELPFKLANPIIADIRTQIQAAKAAEVKPTEQAPARNPRKVRNAATKDAAPPPSNKPAAEKTGEIDLTPPPFLKRD
jgi:hypothetical protein